MRDGIPGKLKSSKFLFANLPDLSRLKNYDIPISSFTVRIRYALCVSRVSHLHIRRNCSMAGDTYRVFWTRMRD